MIASNCYDDTDSSRAGRDDTRSWYHLWSQQVLDHLASDSDATANTRHELGRQLRAIPYVDPALAWRVRDDLVLGISSSENHP